MRASKPEGREDSPELAVRLHTQVASWLRLWGWFVFLTALVVLCIDVSMARYAISLEFMPTDPVIAYLTDHGIGLRERLKLYTVFLRINMYFLEWLALLPILSMTGSFNLDPALRVVPGGISLARQQLTAMRKTAYFVLLVAYGAQKFVMMLLVYAYPGEVVPNPGVDILLGTLLYGVICCTILETLLWTMRNVRGNKILVVWIGLFVVTFMAGRMYLTTHDFFVFLELIPRPTLFHLPQGDPGTVLHICIYLLLWGMLFRYVWSKNTRQTEASFAE